MKAFLLFEKLANLASGTFLFRAVLPWAFVFLLDLGIYELFVPDGRSLIGFFLGLNDDHQSYALLALVAWTAAITLSSDSVARHITTRSRERAAATGSSKGQLPFDLKLWWTGAKAQMPPAKLSEALAARIEEERSATLRNVNLAIGLGISICLLTLELAAHQPNIFVSCAIIFIVWGMMVGSLYLAQRDLAGLIALDALASESESPPASRRRSSRRIRLGPFEVTRGGAFLLAVLALCLFLPILYLWISQLSGIQEARERHLTIIAVNDIYRLDGVSAEKGTHGGLARLRTLRKAIEKDRKNVILLHAGDFLSPSLLGSVYKGRQMVDIMNRMDGDDDGFDGKMFVVFGNHEFDDSKCTSAASPLVSRVAESQFGWLNSNLDFSNCEMLRSLSFQPNVTKEIIRDFGGIKVGLFGIGLTPDMMDGKSTASYPKYEDELLVATRSVKNLRAKGAEYIIAVTHSTRQTDQKLLNALGSDGLNLIVGGHEHDCMALTATDGSAYGFKADSDAKTAWRIDLDFPARGKPVIARSIIKLDESIRPDTDVTNRSKTWKDWAEAEICTTQLRSKNPGCLNDVIGPTQSLLDLDESANRSEETAFGDWIADRMRDQGKHRSGASGHYVAIMNSGALGLDAKIHAGESVYRRQVREIFRFDDKIAVHRFSAKVVCKALVHGFSLRGRGAWPHISGAEADLRDGTPRITIAADKPNDADKKVIIDCEGTEQINVVALPYVLCSRDGYEFLRPEDIPAGLTCEEFLHKSAKDEDFLTAITEKAIAAAPFPGVKMEKNGRVKTPPPEATPARQAICNGDILEKSQYR